MQVEDAFHVGELFVKPIWFVECAVGFEGALALRLSELDREVIPNLVYQHHCLLVEPLYSLSIFPEAILDIALSYVAVRAKTVLFPLVPPSLIFASISPEVDSVALLLVHKVLTIVSHSVRVDVNAEPLHVVGLPLAEVFTAISPEVDTVTMDLIVYPLTFISRAISPGVLSSSFLLTHDVLSLVSGTLRPCLNTLAVLLVLLPLSFVACPFHVGVDSMTIGLVIHPAALVDIAIGMEEFPLAARLVELPLAFVASPVNPFHLALAMA